MATPTADVIPVYADHADDPQLGRQRTILASLPSRFRFGTEKGGVAAVSGLRPGWPVQVRAAVENGARGVFVAEPGPADRDDLLAAVDQAASASVPVAAGLRYTANRSWAAAVGTVLADVAGSALADVVAVTDPAQSARQPALVNALAEQLHLMGQLRAPVSKLTVLAAADDHYVIGGAAGDLVISLTGIASAVAEARLSFDLVGIAQRWSAVIPSVALAAPASISRYSRDGVRTWPALYESGERAAWAQLHAALSSGQPVEASLAAVAAAIATATEVMRAAA